MNYFRSDKKDIYLEAPQAEFYIPESYFTDGGNFAEDLGDQIRTLGIFNVGIFDENGKLEEMKVFNVPTWININIADVETRDVKLPGDDEPVKCRVLMFKKGHKIMHATTVEDSTNVLNFLDFMLKAKLPSTIPYEKAINIWQKNQAMNAANLGVLPVIEEVVISGMYRYKKDPTKKFANVISKDLNMSQYDYKMYNIRKICQYTSTFNAMTFEDIDSMITTSLNRTKTKADEIESPVEQLLKL